MMLFLGTQMASRPSARLASSPCGSRLGTPSFLCVPQ